MLHATNKPEKVRWWTGTALTYPSWTTWPPARPRAVDLGVGPKDRVGIMLPNCAEYVIVQATLMRRSDRRARSATVSGRRVETSAQRRPQAIIYHTD